MVIDVGSVGIIRLRTPEVKAAEDSRTPRRCRDRFRATLSARSWSAAVLRRFPCSVRAIGRQMALRPECVSPTGISRFSGLTI
jgi:hypothetical protein